jgi:hypothetical protein
MIKSVHCDLFCQGYIRGKKTRSNRFFIIKILIDFIASQRNNTHYYQIPYIIRSLVTSGLAQHGLKLN